MYRDRCEGVKVGGERGVLGAHNAAERDLGTVESGKEGLSVALCATMTEGPLVLAHVRTPSQIPELSATVADR